MKSRERTTIAGAVAAGVIVIAALAFFLYSDSEGPADIDPATGTAAGAGDGPARRMAKGTGRIKGRVLAEQAGALSGAEVQFRIGSRDTAFLGGWIDIAPEDRGEKNLPALARVVGLLGGMVQDLSPLGFEQIF